MSVFKKQQIIKSYPAFDVVRREADRHGVINITANETITDESMSGGWYLGSVVSFALESNDCPLEAVERAKTNRHDLHWINAESTCISSSPQDLPARIQIKEDDIIRFEGKLFTIAKAPNNNKRLIPYSQE